MGLTIPSNYPPLISNMFLFASFSILYVYILIVIGVCCGSGR